jgi:hypothetical protein
MTCPLEGVFMFDPYRVLMSRRKNSMRFVVVSKNYAANFAYGK